MDWYVFAVLSIPVGWLARRFPFELGSRAKNLAVHLAGSFAFSVAYVVLRAWLGHFQGPAKFSDLFQPVLVKTWHFNLLIYWVIVAVSLRSAIIASFGNGNCARRNWRSCWPRPNCGRCKCS